MTNHARDLEAFARAVEALDPYLENLVFVGGWAHYLYTLRPEASPIPFEPLRTKDLDVAAPARLPKREHDIAELLGKAGFRECLSGDHVPPVSEYVLGDEEDGFYLEFLVPLVGSEAKRGGVVDATATVAGVTAQKLRFLDLLLHDPWRIPVSEASGFPVSKDRQIFVPNPAAYVVQKMLVMARRRPEDQAKDCLYVHDTFVIFADALRSVGDAWRALRPTMLDAHVRAFERSVGERTLQMNDVIRRAARIAAGRRSAPTPESLLLGLRRGFAAAFGLGER